MKAALTALVLSALAQQAHAEWIEIGTVTPKIAEFPGLPSSLQDLIDKGNPTALSVTIPVERFNTTLGLGYNFLKGEMLIEPCVLQNPGRADYDSGATNVRIAEQHTFINAISSYSQKNQSQNSGVGFGVTYKLVSLGGQFDRTSESFFNNTDAFARIYSRFITREVRRDGGVWSGPARTLAAQKNKKQFLDVCGTHFISAVRYGSLIDQTFKFSLTTSGADKSSRDSLKLGVGKLFNAKLSNDTTETEVLQKSSGEIVKLARGVPVLGQPDVQDPGSISAAVKFADGSYPDRVINSDPAVAQALFVEITPYGRLFESNAAEIPTLSEKMVSAVAAKYNLLSSLMDSISDLQYAKGLGGAYTTFYEGDPVNLPVLLDEATRLKTDFASGVDKCVAALEVLTTPLDKALEDECLHALDILTAAKVDRVSLKPQR